MAIHEADRRGLDVVVGVGSLWDTLALRWNVCAICGHHHHGDCGDSSPCIETCPPCAMYVAEGERKAR